MDDGAEITLVGPYPSTFQRPQASASSDSVRKRCAVGEHDLSLSKPSHPFSSLIVHMSTHSTRLTQRLLPSCFMLFSFPCSAFNIQPQKRLLPISMSFPYLHIRHDIATIFQRRQQILSGCEKWSGSSRFHSHRLYYRRAGNRFETCQAISHDTISYTTKLPPSAKQSSASRPVLQSSESMYTSRSRQSA